MASLDCRLIHPQSPLQTLVIEPVREGRFAIYHGLNECYAVYQRCVKQGCLPDFTLLAQGAAHILTGLALHVPLVNAVVFQIFVSHAGSYHEALRDAVDRGDLKAAKRYLELGVSPNNVYDT